MKRQNCAVKGCLMEWFSSYLVSVIVASKELSKINLLKENSDPAVLDLLNFMLKVTLSDSPRAL